ncbi:probable arabinosyltransferase ARAD1 [Salvia miltiorrhiza]|uniref:probable arabinosyltransferase ARAD1 n=1 Tax=Salvia miltiorrhiza TaxID=226208 RepID=UPI0025ACAA60|nr:probable arabinosyltransferase ARAD1 [Salvia miltiorrhiza]XP_057792076.1 probable arabinosyltransferase ARAD1 [Salvia miltiorrhiza]XP_057792077.1 probable arabinosyltransferase ARAD1 [Salvia miltiorrhiza]
MSSSVCEKRILPSRHLFCLIAIAVFLLISSSLSLIEFRDNPSSPSSVFQFISLSNASAGSNSSRKGDKQGSRVLDIRRPEDRKNVVSEIDSQGSEPKKVEEESSSCDKGRALLRVYMYDLPLEFHFGLLGWRGTGNQIWPSVDEQSRIPSYPGGLNLQHSAEYWLTLDLLASSTASVIRPCSAIRVNDSREADVVFVPFFSSLSYNRHSKHQGKQSVSLDRLLQERLVGFLKGQREWRRSGGKNHLIVAHHPNSMLVAREKLGSAMFVLADFGRYPFEIANVEKDVIAPYKHMVRTIPAAGSAPFSERPILVYFQGAIYRKDGGAIRQELFYLLKDEKDVHFTFGSVQSHGISKAGKGMASSKFCLNIAGDTPSSNRLFDAIASHCVPVIISDEIEPPYEDVLDYSEFCIFVRASDAVSKGYLLNLLRGIKQGEWTKMWEKLKEIAGQFEYQYPSRPNDAVDMIWQTVYRKKMHTKLDLHRGSRYRRSQFQ